jgi:hypothetical protein
MKMLFVLTLSAFAISAHASTYDGDMGESYRSWCEQDNVIGYNEQGQQVIKENCAVNRQVCLLDQKTSGKRVIYSAYCEDKPQSRTSEPKGGDY